MTRERAKDYKALMWAVFSDKYTDNQKRSLSRQYYERYMYKDIPVGKNVDPTKLFDMSGGVEKYLFKEW